MKEPEPTKFRLRGSGERALLIAIDPNGAYVEIFTERPKHLSLGYLQLTRAETRRMRDELTRCLEETAPDVIDRHRRMLSPLRFSSEG